MEAGFIEVCCSVATIAHVVADGRIRRHLDRPRPWRPRWSAHQGRSDAIHLSPAPV